MIESSAVLPYVVAFVLVAATGVVVGVVALVTAIRDVRRVRDAAPRRSELVRAA